MSLISLSQLIDLPESDLQQVLDYATTLSKPEAAEHFKNLLGDSPRALEFIAAFNSRRRDPVATVTTIATPQPEPSRTDGVPKPKRNNRAKKASALHTPAPRRVADIGPAPGTAYNKGDITGDYISAKSRNAGPGAPGPAAPGASARPSKPTPSAAGSLISDLPAVPKPKPRSNPGSGSSTPGSRSSTPGPAPSKSNNASTKISITGGTPMHGASTAVADLDAAIRSLEITTNPTLSDGSSSDNLAARRCNCVATRHPLQAAAPNCLKCGKVVCLKEGLGPCTFCGTPLLSSEEVQAMLKELKAERGKERMAADRQANKRADVSQKPRPFAKPRGGPADDAVDAAEIKAREHRDKLLSFQAQNAQRTTVRDEASDFDISSTGSMWAKPEDRARELKKQQKLLREMEWNARPEYEKRTQVVSIDLVKGKVVKKMVAVERPASFEVEDNLDSDGGGAPVLDETDSGRVSGGGAFSRNPLLKGLIKPVYSAKGKESEAEAEPVAKRDRKTLWRRVQDDLDDNEGLLLDGGVSGGSPSQRLAAASGDEPACG